jgi:hypothetical protein
MAEQFGGESGSLADAGRRQEPEQPGQTVIPTSANGEAFQLRHMASTHADAPKHCEDRYQLIEITKYLLYVIPRNF